MKQSSFCPETKDGSLEWQKTPGKVEFVLEAVLNHFA